MALVLDTGPLLAALDQADPDHKVCAELIVGAREDLVIPMLVLAELAYWCEKRLGESVWLDFLDDVNAGAYRAEPPDSGDLRRCAAIQRAHPGVPLGFVDASVIALLERLGEPKVATLDHRHFAAARVEHVDALTLLP